MKPKTQIKKYRTSLNLSQEELAEKIYVTRQTISNWENDKCYPDIHSLLLLSSVFNISLDQLRIDHLFFHYYDIVICIALYVVTMYFAFKSKRTMIFRYLRKS